MTKKEYERINDNLDGMIQDINPDRMEELYFQKSYDTLKLLWLDTDQEAFEEAEKDLKKLIKRMTPEQHQAALYGEIRAYLNLLYDLRCRLRSEGLNFISIMISYNHILGMVKENLETYEALEDKYFYDQAKDLLGKVTSNFNEKYTKDENLEDMKLFIEKHRDLEDLTPEDREHIDLLSTFVRNQELIKRTAGN